MNQIRRRSFCFKSYRILLATARRWRKCLVYRGRRARAFGSFGAIDVWRHGWGDFVGCTSQYTWLPEGTRLARACPTERYCGLQTVAIYVAAICCHLEPYGFDTSSSLQPFEGRSSVKLRVNSPKVRERINCNSPPSLPIIIIPIKHL